ncbi:MAG: hypothetical protein KDF65_14025 [Anaerolineae bacterium]|nr:hypothetical protein [Anaerolineae bacterium]
MTIITAIIALFLGVVGVAYAAGNIDPAQRHAWGHTIGWVNLSPAHGGATVYADHLEGDAWAESIGWMRLGTHTAGGSHTYANTTADNYGVNHDANGKLSGYAWSPVVGWIDFNPTHGQVTIDPATGAFDGYAWSASVGWIHFKGGAGDSTYGVVTTFSEPDEATTFVTFLPLLIKRP